MKNNINSKTKHSQRSPYSNEVETERRYQKSDQSQNIIKTSNNSSNPFDRSNTRRSLGADVAPQFDITDFSSNRFDRVSTVPDSESSVSDFSNFQKPLTNKRPVQLRNLQTKFSSFENSKSISKSAPASPTKPMPPPRSPHTHMSMLNAYNVRTIGNKIHISIVKKPSLGLGFTIVTRDNQVQYGSAADIANSVVILVNKILPNGGAAEDNRLRPGDRLLEVNGVSVSSLKDATEKLRGIPENEHVNLLISRLDRCETPSKEHQLTQSPQSSIPRKPISFEIPLNHNQKERSKLGINIQYVEDRDKPTMGPGIYVHSILGNSLASQQGGLRADDKLIGINGHGINDTSVEDTIGQLKKIMKTDSVLVVTVYRATNIEPYNSGNEARRKENDQNSSQHKMAQGWRNQESSEFARLAPSSHSRYSSSDSLSHQNSSIYQPDPGSAFVRESKGRRSMSDKRKAHEDASQYTFYKETRLGDVYTPDDRMYSTLPTSSRLKKLSSSQPNTLSNKIQGPLKPSQMKQLNTPKTAQDSSIKVHRPSNRSTSLRSSPARLNHLDPSQSPKHRSQTPSHDVQPSFNRAMNNSFKRAVQKSLPEPGHSATPPTSNTRKSQSLQKEIERIPQQKLLDSCYPNCISRHTQDKFSRSNSVKDRPEKKKSFNLKTFLTFSSGSSKTKPVAQKEKSDTFPLNTQPLYHQHTPVSITARQPPVHTSAELPGKSQHGDDPTIHDSTKRVLEWQIKNEDVISKENKVKDQKIYQTISSHGTVTSKNKPDVKMTPRTPISNRNTFPKTTANQGRPEIELYDTLDGTLTSPTAIPKKPVGPTRSTRINSNSQVSHNSPKNGVNSHSTRITYQIINSRKTSPSNDIYATVNKSAKRESKSPKVSSGPSHGHTNKYRF